MSVVEVLLALALFSLVVMAITGALIYGRESAQTSGMRARATFLAEEGLEATRNIRDENFTTNLASADGNHGLAKTTQWAFSGSSDTTESFFTRIVNVAPIDADTKSITSTVTWQENVQRAGSVVLNTYLTYWQRVVAANWANPTQESLVNMTGTGNKLKVKVQGNYAYLVDATNFFVMDLDNLAGSPVGSLAITGTATNLFVSGTYAYISSTSNNSELQIIDISSPTNPQRPAGGNQGIFDAGGNTDATSVAVSGNFAYLTKLQGGGPAIELTKVNITTKNNPTSSATLNFASNINDIVIIGSYAYLATSAATELQYADINTFGSISTAGDGNLASSAASIDGASGLLTVATGTTINAVPLTSPTTFGIERTLNVGQTINDVSYDNTLGYVFLAENNSTQEFQVINATTTPNPTLVGTYNINNDVSNTANGITYDSTRDRAYIANSADNAEFVVIMPQ